MNLGWNFNDHNKGWNVMAFNRPASLSRKRRLDSSSSRRPQSSGSGKMPSVSLQLRASVGIALALALLPMSSEAAGLGRLNLLSGLGQPLRAEIELTSISREEAGSLVARLAGSDAFSQAKIEYGAALAALRFSVQRRPNGQAFVQVTSTQPVNEPYLDLLVELSWNSGRLVREYTMLLDPPESRSARREADSVVPLAPAIAAPSARASRRDASDAGRAGAASASAGTAGASAAGSDYQVRRGDTAGAIARNNRPEGASLEQMLAALYRNNPQAFGGNINLLKAGAILRLPDANAATSVDRTEAQRFVTAQTGDFSGYRSRLARAASETPSRARAAGQEASGKVTTRVDEPGGPATANKDQLRLSKAEAQKNTGSLTASGTRAGAAPAVSGPTAEDLAIKDRALQEANTRVALLEKNVADLQKLVELKNQNLAELQKQAQKSGAPAATDNASRSPATTSPAAPPALPVPIAPAATATPDLPPPPVVVLPVPTPAPAAPQTRATTPAPTSTPPVAAPKPVAPVAEGQSWFDSLRDNPLMLGALVLLAVLIVGYLLYSLQRRRKFSRFEDSILTGSSALRANSVFGTTGGQSVDTSNSGFHSNFVPIAGATPEHNEVDPVAEADVYIAYGRDAQAEEILKESLRAHADRHAVRLKLLEIYAKRGDAKTFETVASEMYAMTGGQGADWKQAAALGATIDPANPLYRDSPAAESHSIGTQQATTDFDRTRALPALNTAALGAMGLTGAAALAAVSAPGSSGAQAALSDSEFMRTVPIDAPHMEDMTRTDPLPTKAEAASTTSPAMDLDFDLGSGSASQRGAAKASAVESAAKADLENRPGSSANALHGMDFDFGMPKTDALDPLNGTAASDPSIRTAVNLPAFRAQPDPLLDAPAFASPETHAEKGFTASDIFGSSMSANTEPVPDVSGVSPPAPPAPAAHAQEYGQFDKTEPFDALSGISLDLDSGAFGEETHINTALGSGKFGEATHINTDLGAKTGAWQAMATKLDLAAAYRDIGDADGARELLEEVIKGGDAAQIDHARRLIGELG